MTTKKFFQHPLGVMFAAVTATFLWGSALPFVKWSYEVLDIHPNETWEQLLFAGYRFFLASLMIIVFFQLIGRGIGKITLSSTFTLARIGFFQTFLQYILFYIGLSHSTGIQGSIIAGSTSFFQMLLAHFIYQNDRMNAKKSIGLVVGFSGVVLVNVQQGTLTLAFGLGEILLTFAMLTSAFGNILAREGSQKLPVPYLTAYQMLIGSVGLLVIGGLNVGWFPFDFTGKAVMLLIYLSFISAAGFILWNNVMKYNKVGNVSIYLFLVPMFGVMLSGIVLKESVHMFALLGLALVVSGIIIVNKKSKKPQVQKEV
ncbi:DMT family transporter [Salirhabdus salicampi]|uniref:DMT family transporter n=1 Tax=Salirhabdus salicampi TaxID=476102 RepID=UPI0020C3A5EE|nr:DMT family transporter [Salirhabdus salicampi]MCP8617912.1 DMT family transporter [Salirhabdus salicampi]